MPSKSPLQSTIDTNYYNILIYVLKLPHTYAYVKKIATGANASDNQKLRTNNYNCIPNLPGPGLVSISPESSSNMDTTLALKHKT
jgi:hypothetical protein